MHELLAFSRWLTRVTACLRPPPAPPSPPPSLLPPPPLGAPPQCIPSDEALLRASDPRMETWKPVNVCHFVSQSSSSFYNCGSSIIEHSQPFPWFIKRGETLPEIRERLRLKCVCLRPPLCPPPRPSPHPRRAPVKPH